MKKIRTYIFVIATQLLLVSKASAFYFCLPIDGCPIIDFTDEIESMVHSVVELANTVSKEKGQIENDINNLKMAKSNMLKGELSSIIDIKDINPGMRSIEQCTLKGKKYDNKSEEDIYELVNKLFMQYPEKSDVEYMLKKNYDGHRYDFYHDAMIEIYTASEGLKKVLETEIRDSIDNTIACLNNENHGGAACGGDFKSDSQNEAFFVGGKALDALDNLYQILLKVTALKAQFEAVQIMYATQPRECTGTDSKDKGSSPDKASESKPQAMAFPAYLNSHIEGSQQLWFAKISDGSKSKADEEDFGFNMPPEVDDAHPYVYEEDKMMELEKLEPLISTVDKAREIHNIIHGLSSYKNAAESAKEMAEQHKKALKSFKIAADCTQNYIGRHFSNPSSVLGVPGKINDYDSYGALGGWAIKSYEAAKAAQATTFGSDDIILADVEPQEEVSDKFDPSQGKDFIKDNKIKPAKSKEEKAIDENRQTNLISWQIGSEASKQLADNANNWGAPLKDRAFPIWQDTRNFYDQYIEGKYNNIKEYFKSYTAGDLLSLVADVLEGKNAQTDNGVQNNKADAIKDKLSDELNSVQKSHSETLKANRNAGINQVNQLKQQREQLVKRMDDVSDKLKKINQEISDLSQKADEDAGNKMQEQVTFKEEFPSNIKATPSGKKLQDKVFTFDENQKEFSTKTKENKKEASIDKLREQSKQYQEELESLEQQLKELDNKIKQLQFNSANNIPGINQQVNEQKQSLLDNAADAISSGDVIKSSDVRSRLIAIIKRDPSFSSGKIPVKPEKIYEAMEHSANEALSSAYVIIDKEVDRTLAQIKKMGDNLYDPQNHGKIVALHNSLIDNIKKIAVSVAVPKHQPVQGIKLYAKLLSKDNGVETQDYFVGSPAKARDIKAPKAIFASNLPPLHEVVHFDEFDLQNVKPYLEKQKKSPIIDNLDFLNMGQEIPMVWQYMLKTNTYVETSMDLKKALNLGDETIAFLRGGYMPCRVKNSSIFIDVDKDGNYARSSFSGNMSECPYLEIKDGKVYHSFSKIYPNLKSANPKKELKYSELGTLLDADESGTLRFRQSTYDAYYKILYNHEHSEAKHSDDFKHKLSVAENANMAFNQMGDFLKYAENEKTIRKQKEDAEQEYANLMKKLKEDLEAYGFEISDSLDMSNEDDYNFVREKLKSVKKDLISQAQSAASEINTGDNEVVKERVETQKKVIKAIKKDENEDILISGAVEDDNNLDEKIKTSKVNDEVAGKYTNSLDKASDAVKLPETPFCAFY